MGLLNAGRGKAQVTEEKLAAFDPGALLMASDADRVFHPDAPALAGVVR